MGDITDEAVYRLEAVIGAHPTNDTAAARAVVAALRADLGLAAGVLDGEIHTEWRRYGVIDREPWDGPGEVRDVLVVDGPWRKEESRG